MTETPEMSELIAIKMTPQFLEMVDKLADKHHMNRSRFIRYVLREYADRAGVEIKNEVLYEST